jgi:IclR family transcriptional regulator, acetate operon repressor
VTSPNGTQAIDRAALLLTQVVHRREPVTFAELAAASGLAKSTTSRLLTALERHQLVRRDGSGRFWPGQLFIRYAWRGTRSADLVALAYPYLARLGEQTGETVNLGIAVHATAGDQDAGDQDAMVEQIAQVDSRFMIGGTNWVGLKVPLHCSALGKVLLAFGAAELPAGRLRPRTPRTITTRAALNSELALVRRRGFAVTDAELEPGLVAVAAPVFADGQVPVAAISVSGPSARLTADQVPSVARMCAAAASGLSCELAAPPAPPGARGDGPPSGPDQAVRRTASSHTEGAA